MNVFELRQRIVNDYGRFSGSFVSFRDSRIAALVEEEVRNGLLWPDPLLQLNPRFESGSSIEALVAAGTLHPACAQLFRVGKSAEEPVGSALRLHRHQAESIQVAALGANYVLTTGTGSGKSLAYIVPIVDHVLRAGPGQGVRAIVVYPMNALANSQEGELRKFLEIGARSGPHVTFRRYTGQEDEESREAILANPPDILLTNYVMLELLMTRPKEQRLIRSAKGLRFLVLDELHTYRGRQGADVALLIRRVREQLQAPHLQCVGTSATMASGGSYAEQRQRVAQVAALLFGDTVRPEHVIGETLRRVTAPLDARQAAVRSALRARVTAGVAPQAHDALRDDVLASWIESTFGLAHEQHTGRLIRAVPCPLSGPVGASAQLAELTGLDEPVCEAAIRGALLAGADLRDPETGLPVFAFRLHQFVSRGDTVYASAEPEPSRHVTVRRQNRIAGRGEASPEGSTPGSDRVLLPLVFCRECGQEYYCVRVGVDRAPDGSNRKVFRPRDLSDRLDAPDGAQAGFLFLAGDDGAWPSDADDEEILRRVPDTWLETRNGRTRVRYGRRDDLPQTLHIDALGREAEPAAGVRVQYFRAPFRFCLRCGVTYGARQHQDYGKLATLGSEGRSTATTILSLSSIRHLRSWTDLEAAARKLLSFTDNRQDASLQAGHFNDFIEITLLRSALVRACRQAGDEGLTHDVLALRVFDALALPFAAYAKDPDVRFAARHDAERAFREVLGYRLYRDLRRGWRVTCPNLEQCGLLHVRYAYLEEVCCAEDVWQTRHEALRTAAPQTRAEVATTLLDFLRRGLAVDVSYLRNEEQERLQRLSSQHLREPWSFDESETLERGRIAYPRSSTEDDHDGGIYVSARCGFGQYLGREATFPRSTARRGLEDRDQIIRDLLSALREGGLVRVVREAPAGGVPGYQVPASALRWHAGDGSAAVLDPIRVPRGPAAGGRPNPFFVDLYGTVAEQLPGVMAREHTAQVPYDERQVREDAFRAGSLPILYCSPTMELGIDIRELNVVHMRNVPPTPANYAQRSGRAGRSGSPALVLTYCSGGSSHDQYYFRQPRQLVQGVVSPPRIELANEDLVRAHIHAIWLAETGVSLERSLNELLDLAQPTLPLLPSKRDGLEDAAARRRAAELAGRVIDRVREELVGSGWYHEDWLQGVLLQALLSFEAACARWRGLYLAATAQRDRQHAIASDPSRTQDERKRARRLRAEAENQIELLTRSDELRQSDFYSYRYFASEGFLPGYNFPRLPLSAFIPGRRRASGRDEFLSRPRFLAISEFGPRASVYHEGARYQITQVILPVDRDDVLTSRAKLCEACGYAHPLRDDAGMDVCERCGAALRHLLPNLFRMENVATKRRDRITSDEEERLRLGYEIRTAYRFAERGGRPALRRADILVAGEPAGTLTYGPASTIWRINLGWSRRRNPHQYGFGLDVERGFWRRNEMLAEDEDGQDESVVGRTRMVVPFVEDRRNCLLFEPARPLPVDAMASLEAALKRAIQNHFHLEESELASEALPSRDERSQLLFYEAAEGGAGVLKRLVEDAGQLAVVAFEALETCHFDPEAPSAPPPASPPTSATPGTPLPCVAACYDCLMSYGNQRDHDLLDRRRIEDFLRRLAAAEVHPATPGAGPTEHLAELRRQAGSDLERLWLSALEANALRLPTHAQHLISACSTRPDFFYADQHAAVYIDGPPHDYPERQARDAAQEAALEDAGYFVIRFSHREDWEAVFRANPGVFGELREPLAAPSPAAAPPPAPAVPAAPAPTGYST